MSSEKSMETFPITSWTFLRQVTDRSSPAYTQHLRRLVELYWWPIYRVIRHSWHKSDEDARDLTQEFFATHIFDSSLMATLSPDRGSFRGLIRVAVGHFMSKEVRDATRLKRGGDAIRFSLDDYDGDLEALGDLPAQLSPEEALDLAWKKSVTDRALELTRRRLLADGKQRDWDLFYRYEVEEDREHLSYEELGAPLGLTAAKVKHALIQARALFKDAVIDVIREYVDGADALHAELKALFGS